MVAMPNKEHQNLREMIEDLIKAQSPPSELHQCPECGGELRVEFTVYTRGRKRMLGVRAQCSSCGVTAYFDYAEPLPSWLEDEQ
jgi:transcription elongation factor Elf1